MKNRIKSNKTRYLLGLSGQNILYALVSSCFAYYLQFTVLIPAFWLGIILSTARVFDAVKDPVIGSYINRGRHPLSKYLYYLPIPTGIVTVLCFTIKTYSAENGDIKNAFIIISSFVIFIIWEIIFSFGDIPMVSYPEIICKDSASRTKLLALRPVGAMVCSICCLVVQPLAFAVSDYLGGSQNDERRAFFIIALIFSAIGVLLFQMTTVKGEEKNKPQEKQNKKHQYKYVFTNPLLKKIIASGMLASMTSLQGVIMPALVAYYFSSKNSGLTLLYTFLLGTGNFVGLMLSAIFVPMLSEKFGNIKSYVFCNIASIFPNISIFLIFLKNKSEMNSFLNFAAMFVLMLVSGVFMSFASSIRTLLINDAVDLEKQISGEAPTALFFSFQTAIVKIQTALSSLVSSVGYMLIGFTSAETQKLNEYVASGLAAKENQEYALLFTMLFFMFTVLPAISSLLAALPFLQKTNSRSLTTGVE